MTAGTSVEAVPPDPAGATAPLIGDITVETERRREQVAREVRAYVDAITIQNPDDALARWQVPVCPAVAGLPFDAGKFVFERVSSIANDAGIPLGKPDCRPNLLIVLTREPEALLRSWLRMNPRLFSRERGVAVTERTIRTPAAVRVFYNACSIPAEMTKTFGARVLGACGAPGAIDSRLRRSVARIIYSAARHLGAARSATRRLARAPRRPRTSGPSR